MVRFIASRNSPEAGAGWEKFEIKSGIFVPLFKYIYIKNLIC